MTAVDSIIFTACKVIEEAVHGLFPAGVDDGIIFEGTARDWMHQKAAQVLVTQDSNRSFSLYTLHTNGNFSLSMQSSLELAGLCARLGLHPV